MTPGLAGKRALVTGAARGIGAAIAARLASDAARVALVDIEQAEPSSGSIAIQTDVSDEDAVAAAFGRAVQEFGGLDVVVVNAATQLIGRDGSIDSLELDAWRDTLDVNLTGAFLTAKHGARALLDGDGGAIVCVGSPAGEFGIAAELATVAPEHVGP